jgi:hypothetical protein
LRYLQQRALVSTAKFILLANALDTLASLLNSSQFARVLFHLSAVIITITITIVILSTVLDLVNVN